MSNPRQYSDAFVILYRTAAALEALGQEQKAAALDAVITNDTEALDRAGIDREGMKELYSDIQTALREEGCSDEVRTSVADIFRTPLKMAGVTLSSQRLVVAKSRSGKSKGREMYDVKVNPHESLVDYLDKSRAGVKEITRPNVLEPFKRNMDHDMSAYSDIGTPMEASEKATGYEGVNQLYSRRPNEDVNKKRFKQTVDAHDEGVLILPSYMNNGVFYRDDIRHLIMENIANRQTTGLSHYVGAVPMGFEDLRNIGNLAVEQCLKDDIDGSKKVAAFLYSTILKKFDSIDKKAYDGASNLGKSENYVPRSIIYPVRPESNVLQYAHKDRAINIDPRSLSGIIMRIDVKQKAIENAATTIPQGKTANDIKAEYIRLLTAGKFKQASNFKKLADEMYDVNCGEYDDKVLEMAHPQGSLQVLDGFFPTLDKQQDIDSAAATSNPTGNVSDKTLKLSFIDTSKLLDRIIEAKRKAKAKGKKVEEKVEDVFVVPTDKLDDLDIKDVPFNYPGSAGGNSPDILQMPNQIMETGPQVDELEDLQKSYNVSVNTDPNTGQINVGVNLNVTKKFKNMQEAMGWAKETSEKINGAFGDKGLEMAASWRIADVVCTANYYNSFVDYLKRVYAFSNNIQTMLDVAAEVM